jgi:hypothetical protein
MIWIIIGIIYFLIGFLYTYIFFITRFGTLKLTKKAFFQCVVVGCIWPYLTYEYNIKQFRSNKPLTK